MTNRVHLISTSRAEDAGYLALHDLAECGKDLSYRVIGGHMVQLLMHLYPCPGLNPRATADADAGVTPALAAEQELHRRLTDRGYGDTRGNSYRRGVERNELQIDILVPASADNRPQILTGRAFDSAPGLGLAMSLPALLVEAKARLTDGTDLSFTVPVPSVEAAVVMKTLVRQTRIEPKDLADLSNLLEIAFMYRERDDFPWKLDDPNTKAIGSRRDTMLALNQMADRIDRMNPILNGSGVAGPRFTALIRALVLRP